MYTNIILMNTSVIRKYGYIIHINEAIIISEMLATKGEVSKSNIFFVLNSFKSQSSFSDDITEEREVEYLKRFSLLSAHPSERIDDERASMIGECFTFAKPDSSEHSRVPRSHSCFYTRVLDLLTGGGS